MVWIAPPDFTDGQIVTETQLDVLSNDLNDLNSRTQLIEGTAGRGIIAWGRRGTQTPNATTTTLPVLRISGIPVFSNRMYVVETNNIAMFTSNPHDVVAFEIGYTTNGTDATVSSPILLGSSVQAAVDNTTHGDTRPLVSAIYRPATNHTLSILLRVLRKPGGTGNAYLFANSDTGGQYSIDLWVRDLGPTLNPSGVSL